MITSMEIHNYQFKKAIRGFDQEEVKEFLEIIADDYEALFVENAQLKEEIQRLEYELSKFKRLEETMNNSLILAQQTAENIKTNAQMESEKLIDDAKRKVMEIFVLYQDVIKRLNMFNLELKGQVAGQMEILEKNQKKVEEMTEFFFGRDLKEVLEKIEKAELKGK
ncbi:MAG TPA: DivIVA domain-containing protein [Syntrophomonadaceae bacterium]|nr:DivIVA domain-containing protein [Syntrophomonadaceae bacterium]HRX21334.1 DivIVA domain-containing protein [Syntrophomonadaceae bacterium]